MSSLRTLGNTFLFSCWHLSLASLSVGKEGGSGGANFFLGGGEGEGRFGFGFGFGFGFELGFGIGFELGLGFGFGFGFGFGVQG